MKHDINFSSESAQLTYMFQPNNGFHIDNLNIWFPT